MSFFVKHLRLNKTEDCSLDPETQLHKASVISAVLSLVNSHGPVESWFIILVAIIRWLILHMLKQVAERIQVFVNLS